MLAYEDPNHEGNSAKYLTGKRCIECGKPAGTKWGKFWCFDCNVKRIKRIDKQFSDLSKDYNG